MNLLDLMHDGVLEGELEGLDPSDELLLPVRLNRTAQHQQHHLLHLVPAPL